MYYPKRTKQPDANKAQRGFGLLGILLILLVLVVVAGSGVYVWHRDHKAKKPVSSQATTTASTTGSSKSDSSSSTAAPADPHAGWKSYCDTTYHYCFKYPTDWTLTVQLAAQQPCDAGQVTIANADGTVDVSYQNDNNDDGNLSAITPTSVEASNSANQGVTVLGSYLSATGSNYLPSYTVIDSSLLTTYPLTVGTSTQFPEPAEFTDQGTGTMSCTGSFTSTPAQPVGTLDDAKAWFTTADAKTSLLILKSFYYN